jgi:YgiT-type zinc finger domain-containing protein
MKKCTNCGAAVERDSRPVVYTFKKKHSIKLDQPGNYCNGCGEVFLSVEDMKFNKKELNNFKRSL